MDPLCRIDPIMVGVKYEKCTNFPFLTHFVKIVGKICQVSQLGMKEPDVRDEWWTGEKSNELATGDVRFINYENIMGQILQNKWCIHLWHQSKHPLL